MKLAIVPLADGSVSLRSEADQRIVFLTLTCGDRYEQVPAHIKAEAITAAAIKVMDYLTGQEESFSRSEKILQGRTLQEPQPFQVIHRSLLE